jgi:hypothetical protein
MACSWLIGFILLITAVVSSARGAEWRGLDRVEFTDAAEKERTLDLLDRYAKFCEAKPALVTPLSLFLKGDSESVVQANRMIVEARKGTFEIAHGLEPMVMLQMFGDQLTPEARGELEMVLGEAIKRDGWCWTIRTGLYNINWTINAASKLIVAGQELHAAEAIPKGKEKLQAVLDGITAHRLGTVSEFNNLTYYCVNFTALSILTRYADEEAIRIKARMLEERLWLDFASRYQPEIAHVAGPYDSAYTATLVGGSAAAIPNIERTFDSHALLDFAVAMKSYNPPVELSWIPIIAALMPYCPDYIRQIAMEKTYPYEVRGVSASDQTGNLPLTHMDLHTFLSRKWALGSQSRDWLDGHSDAACVAHWGKRLPVRTMKDFKTMFSHYQMNGSGLDFRASVQPELGREESIQDGGTVLMCYKPKTQALRAIRYKDTYEHGLKQMGVVLEIPLYDEIDELFLDGKALDPASPDVTAECGERTWICLRDGDVYVGIHPLMPTRLGGSSLRIRRPGSDLFTIAIQNLDVETARAIPDGELDRCKNGFVLEMGDRSQYATLENFRRKLEAGRVSDEVSAGDVRSVRYTNGDQSLSLAYNIVTEAPVVRAVNGHPVEYPLFKCPDAWITDRPMQGGLTVGTANLQTDRDAYVWLVSNPARNIYAAYHTDDARVSMRLRLPQGRVDASRMGYGKVVVRTEERPSVEIWAANRQGPVVISKALASKVMLNGKDVTARMEAAEGDNVRLP